MHAAQADERRRSNARHDDSLMVLDGGNMILPAMNIGDDAENMIGEGEESRVGDISIVEGLDSSMIGQGMLD